MSPEDPTTVNAERPIAIRADSLPRASCCTLIRSTRGTRSIACRERVLLSGKRTCRWRPRRRAGGPIAGDFIAGAPSVTRYPKRKRKRPGDEAGPFSQQLRISLGDLEDLTLATA